MKKMILGATVFLSSVASVAQTQTITLSAGSSVEVRPSQTMVVQCAGGKSGGDACSVERTDWGAYNVLIDGKVFYSTTSMDTALSSLAKFRDAGACN